MAIIAKIITNKIDPLLILNKKSHEHFFGKTLSKAEKRSIFSFFELGDSTYSFRLGILGASIQGSCAFILSVLLFGQLFEARGERKSPTETSLEEIILEKEALI